MIAVREYRIIDIRRQHLEYVHLLHDLRMVSNLDSFLATQELGSGDAIQVIVPGDWVASLVKSTWQMQWLYNRTH